MKISLQIEANSDEFEQIIRTIIFGQISDEDLKKPNNAKLNLNMLNVLLIPQS